MTVSAGMTLRLVQFAADRGASAAMLLERAGIATAALDDQDGRVPFRQYVAAMRAAKELTGDPALPLRFGSLDMAEFSIVGMIFKTCETVLESLHQINRYGRLVIDVDTGEGDRFKFARRADGLWLTDTRPDPDAFPELTETTFARFIGMTRPLAATILQEVEVTHPRPAHADAYRALFRVPVRFSAGSNAMRLDEAALVQPIRQEPRYVFGIFCERADALLATLQRKSEMRSRVESLVLPILHTGQVSVDRVARDLSCSRQTIYRKLKAEGTTFEAISDALRHRMALSYLAGSKLSVNETAYLVGFSDQAAFSRAFKRWTGASPRSYRRANGPGE